LKSEHTFYTTNSFGSFPLEDESVNLMLTSPPYPMVEMWDELFSDYNRGIKTSLARAEGNKAFEKMHILLDATWSECYRVLKQGGYAIVNIGDATRSLEGHFQLYSNHSRIIQSMVKIGFDTLPYIIWKKPTNSPTKFMGSGMLPSGAYVTLEHEHILIFRKSGKREFTEQEKDRRRECAMLWEERNIWYSDQWEILGTRQKLDIGASRDRSAAYPLDIPLRLIMMYSIYGDVILDPFSGTGTTSLAAMYSGRNSIYFDNSSELVQSSIQSLSDSRWKEHINDHQNHRLNQHLEYCKSKGDLFFKYRHEGYKIPIKTQQEKQIQLYSIKEIKGSNRKVSVQYQKLKYPIQMGEMLI
jgi:modification methylase